MKKLTILRIGSFNRDLATGLEGMITHLYYYQDGSFSYLLQPKGLNLETGLPLDKLSCERTRFERHDDTEEIEIPEEVLGTQVMDEASGFTGMATAFVRHTNGCFHVIVQPAGVLAKTGAPVERSDFDIRRLTGPAIQPLTPVQRKASEKKNPSPDGAGLTHQPGR